MMAMRLFSLFFLQSNPNLDKVIRRKGGEESLAIQTPHSAIWRVSLVARRPEGDRVWLAMATTMPLHPMF